MDARGGRAVAQGPGVWTNQGVSVLSQNFPVLPLIKLDGGKYVFAPTALRGVYSDTTQLNSTKLTQLNSVQPISAKQVSRVFVYDVINGPLT